MKSMCFAFALLQMIILTGCSTHLIHENGEVQSCQAVGIGSGIPVAAIGYSMCKSSARKLGYHEFEIDTGITGIFLMDDYYDGQGLTVRNVWNNSPAMCAGIHPGQYLYQVENREVKNSEDAYDLLDNRSKERVNVVIVDDNGNKSKLILDKMKVGKPYQCKRPL